MRRRQFLGLVGGASISWPLMGHAQQTTLPVVGFLNSASADGYASMAAAFRQGLKETGYVEGNNVAIEYRWADDRYDRLPALATDLVNRRVAVIFANSPSIAAAKAATSTIPIIIMSGDDPVRLGFVASFNRPGGNITGVSILSNELAAKRSASGRRTEIDFLNGLVVREGEKVGLSCRANAVLTDIVKRVERGELKPDPRHITELRLN